MVEEVPQYADGTLAWEQSTTWHYEPDSFVPLAKQTHSQDQLHYIVTDHLGTPRELLTEDGTPVWQQQYSVWGKGLHDLTKTTAANDAPVDCALRFQGQYHDAESGLHYNFHRYYDPNAAQYLSSDPIGLLGGMRPQGYVDNPNGWVDPLGLAGQYLTTDPMGDKTHRKLVKNIAQNGLKDCKIKYVIKSTDGRPYVVHGSNRLGAARILGITDQLNFEEVSLPYAHYLTEDDLVFRPISKYYGTPPKMQN